jgi:hypothetical protein
VIPSLNRQVLDWLGPDRSAVVRLDLGSGGPENFLALTNPMGALTLRLTKSGVPVRFAPFWRAAYGDRFVADPGAATRRLVLVFADGRSAPPEPGQEVVARAGPYAVYGSRLEPTASG